MDYMGRLSALSICRYAIGVLPADQDSTWQELGLREY